MMFSNVKANLIDWKMTDKKGNYQKILVHLPILYGGFILIGPQTTKSIDHPLDNINEIKYIDKSLINLKQYEGVINSWIYPKISGIKFYFEDKNDNKNKGIFIIEIPRQNELLKPFLITKSIQDNRKTDILFGFSERISDSSQHKDIKTLHTLIRDGISYSNTMKHRLDSIDSQILSMLLSKNKIEKQKSLVKHTEINSKRIIDILKVNDMINRKSITLSAFPESTITINNLFDKTPSSILNKLEKPDIIRNSGWDLQTLDKAKPYNNEFIQVCNGNRKTIRLYKDGNLLFSADQDFWFWPDEKGIRLNSLALIEGIYNFINFYKSVVNEYSEKNKKFSVICSFFKHHLNNKITTLFPGHLKNYAYTNNDNKKLAPNNNNTFHEQLFNFNTESKDSISYQIIKEIYIWFGFLIEEWTIPYTSDKISKKIIDVNKIREVV